ncbi:Msx2-interacting protein [Armadillidium vulgare]|nr:Msx2-interacting protein [Armadillidium vulgare]
MKRIPLKITFLSVRETVKNLFREKIRRKRKNIKTKNLVDLIVIPATKRPENHTVIQLIKKQLKKTQTHHFKLGSVKESSPISRNDKTLVNNLSSNSTVSENISLEKTQRESNCSFENITAANKSPPLDMPIIKPDEIEVEPEPIETAVEEKTHKISVDSENAVQSISATDEVSKRTQPIYEITESLSSPPQACPVEEVAPKASRSTISQEETLNAVAGLLACYNYYQEETSPNQTDDEPILHSESTAAIEDPIEQSEEAQKAAQMLQSEIGVEREPEDRDDSWEEPLPLNETDENIDESPAIMTSPEHSDNNTSQTDTKKTEELQISHEEHEHNDTTAKEPLQFPDSPSSVQSEPALQIDEDEQIETLETSITEEKVNVVREVAALPQERSSVWNTPESDIQEGKPLGLTEESLENKNVGTTICEEEKSSESTSVPVSGDKYNSANEADVIQENETSNFPSDEAPKVDNESNPYSKTACDTVLTTVDNCSASVNSESVVDKDVKEDIKLSDSPVPEIKSECSSNLVTVKEEPNDLPNDSFLPDSKEDMTEESSKTVENIVKKSEELIAATSVVSGDEKCMETSIEEKDKRLEGVLNSETECKNESMISDSQDFHTPSKSSEDLNTSVESSTTEMSTPEKDFKLEEPEIRNFTPRGRARGRGRRGCRRVVDNASSAVMSTILTRSSSANAKNSKPRGRGRSIRNTEIGEEEISGENITPEQPRRSTRMKRARKHPDMVEHDETTNRRKRGGRNGKSSGEDVGLRTSLSSSDVYDFHDSDEGEIEVALGKKGQKRETNKPPTPRSPSKLSEEVPDIHDSAGNTRKSRRLREKNLDDDPNLQTAEGDLESETPPAPLTRSRGRIKKDDNDDDICNTPRKSPRSRIKINENDQEPSRDNPTGNESSISEVVIQKIESPVNSIIPPVSVPAKTIIIPCSTTKVFTTSIPTITTQITAMSINAIPSVYSSTVSSHPVKLSIVPAGLRNVSKVTPATCMISSNSYSVTSPQSSAVTVTSVPVSSQIQMENFVTQNIPFAVTSSKEIISNPVKSVVPINCNSIPPSAFKTFPNGKKPDSIPTPLVDPVTGHLTPMKMSDEGHYIPIADHLSLANKDKLNQSLHQAKVLKVFPSSITVTTITNSNPSVTLSIPSCTVSTLVSPIRAVGISSLAKGAAVTSLASRGNEISVELVSRPRPSVPPPSTANILLSSPKGIPNYNTKSPISITSSHTSTPPVTNSVIVSSHATVPQTNTPNIVTIATSNKIFSTSSSAIPTTTSSVAARGTVLSSTLAPIKGSIPAKIQPLPVAVPKQQQQQQPAPSSPAGPIGTVSLSRIPPVRSNAVVHEPHIQEFVSMGVNPRYSEPNNSRYRESSIVEVARIQGGTPSALSPVPRNPEVEATHISSRTHYDMHAATPNSLSRQGMRGSPSGPIPHVPAPVGSKGGLTHFYGEIHKKGGTPQPHPVVPPGVPVERYLASPPLHTPPSTQTPPPPPPAHHNTQRENLPINMYRTPYIVSDPRALYSGEKISNLSPMPMDLKVIEKTNHISDKVSQEDKDRPSVGPISISEFSSSRPGTVITPHNSTSPHHLPSPHYDRSTDSPQVTMMYNRRYYEGNIYPPNRSGTPGMEPEAIPRSPLSFATSALPPGEPHHSPRLQIAAPQFTPQVSPQMPPQADSFQYMLQNYPVMWDGILGLKNEQVMVKMHFISGSVEVARGALPEGSTTSLIRISQRMRLEQSQLEGVARKMQSAYVIHIFPPCEFANENLRRIAPELHGVAQTSRLLVIIATC